MSQCVELIANGTLQSTGHPVESCAGYVLVSGSEYAVFTEVHRAFSQPTAAQVSGWFSGAFSLVMLMFLAARMAGSVAGMFK